METLEQREPLESLMESFEPAVMIEPLEGNHGIVETLEQSETLESLMESLGPAVMMEQSKRQFQVQSLFLQRKFEPASKKM